MFSNISIDGRSYGFYSIKGFEETKKLPYSLRILLENLLRYKDLEDDKKDEREKIVKEEHIDLLLKRKKGSEIPFFPERVILQDFTGVPLITDIAVMRDVAKKFGKDPKIINPIKRCDLVIDHSVQVDFFGMDLAFELNTKKEFERNRERYEFLKWAQENFKNIRVIPPGAGIIHQVNLEFLADVVRVEKSNKRKKPILFPDTLLGTDSHTTMINAIGVLGWGVGGIEAEAVMLGEPNYIVVPETVGVKLIGKPKEGVTATDIVLTITEILRKKKVVDKFVEFFGPGLKNLSVPDRATISNMSPEYGARCGFFPVDSETLKYLELTGRSKKHLKIVEAYLKRNMLFYEDESKIEFDDVVEIDLEKVEPSVAGPSRPHDRISLGDLKSKFISYLGREKKEVEVDLNETERIKLRDGSVVLSAITSCTNTSNPHLMIGAGILAKKAVERGLRVPGYVKTSNAPGSLVVAEYLERAGLMPYLKALGFHITGYGCTVCIGNSGPINEKIEQAIKKENLVAVSVLSGNRNFEARIHPSARANFLMSPPLVVAFAIAGRIDINLLEEPIGYDPNGNPVYLKDIWPQKEEVERFTSIISSELFKKKYSNVFEGTEEWKKLKAPKSDTYSWDQNSTYIKAPPFFENFEIDEPKEIKDIKGARLLLILGDSITTDHISPAGNIKADSPAGKYLVERGVKPVDFNNYGARRGNWEVMVRGTFANIRLKNLMVDLEGGYTVYDGKVVSVFEASEMYKKDGVPLLVIAGKEYGSGSSRDWAAKGPALLGIKAVIAESFETIHRSNLVGMGIVPLQFKSTNLKELQINGSEIFNIPLKDLAPQKEIEVEMVRSNGESVKFQVIAKINTYVEVDYIRHGGILPYVLRKILKNKAK
ncbi:MAG: aconitate hydratase AcnA [Candidatus Calescibacterium sp.]|nr:aconitate hydratase AcnA [Candidatus Calescibacterium sp.]MDW8087064.1 aconitate hydratase AcnA [Candidatus Calescibacterium sp.]